MPDITMCKNTTCPLRENCYRFMAEPSKYLQSYTTYPYNDGCDYYWPMKKDNDKKTK